MIHTADADFTLLNCDVLDGLRSLPDESVHCVVTSPPYWGLRDYGTGSWDGGDPDCDHSDAKIKTRYDYKLSDGAAIHRADSASRAPGTGTDASRWRDECPCGARRVDQQLGLEP